MATYLIMHVTIHFVICMSLVLCGTCCWFIAWRDKIGGGLCLVCSFLCSIPSMHENNGGQTQWHTLLPVLVTFNVHLFLSGKPQLSETEVTKTRRIASVRIHVERAINRMKTYRIFKSALCIASRRTISDMIFVCAGLCNLKAPLIAKQNDAV